MASATSEAASSSSSLPHTSADHLNHYTYEVFLSFRGEDTRSSFTDHLHSALCERGIKTFIDDELKRGEEISSALVKAIEESRVSIIIFSQNYASSRWCLDELVKILECRKSKGQEVRSVFYKVDPSDVRHQRGAFGAAFATLDQCKYKNSMEKWRAALTEAADLSGWPFQDGEYEAKYIKKIVEELSAQVVNPSCQLHVTRYPVGLKSCREIVNRLLKVEENIVRMVGIWGPGGIGKTTIAKDVFNSIRHKYAGSCFMAEVRSNSTDLAHLQERLLVDILRDSSLKVSSVDQGVSFIETRMRHKKVLLILDDVSHSRQLQNLVPSPDCFGPGSRILITTRDKRLLTAYQVDEIYEVKMLDYDRALELFSLYAFKRNGPPGNYLKLAQRAVSYAQGLPLALIVLGSHLFGRSRDEWEATLDSCNGEDPHMEIRNVLKISYDALGVDLKGYFLDIACFFKGKYVEDVMPILEACYDLKSVNGFVQLQEKALIRIDKNQGMGKPTIWMHDLIEEMGKDIVYQESPGEPGERSRIWSGDDINHVLTNHTGTNKVMGIHVSHWQQSSAIYLNDKSFSGMKNLRYLSMFQNNRYKYVSGDMDYLSNQLRWLDWRRCPMQSFPSGFHANKLVELRIPSCRITQLWEGCKNFSSLRRMNLEDCESLTELPDFGGIPNLEALDLSNCRSLIKIPDSLGLLLKLVHVGANNCWKLRKFPRKINLKSVKYISLTHSKLEELAEVVEEMGSLKSLDLRHCHRLATLPCNIYESQSLRFVDASFCSKLAAFPSILKKMVFLRSLDLSFSGIEELDESIGNLVGLRRLRLSDCHNLRTLPCSIYGLQQLTDLYLDDCSKLVRFPTNPNIMNGDGCSVLSLPMLDVLDISGCGLSDCDFLTTLDCCETLKMLHLSRNNFVSLPAGITKFVNLEWLDLYGCDRLKQLPKELPPKTKLLGDFQSLDTEEMSPSIEDDYEEDPTPSSEPSTVIINNALLSRHYWSNLLMKWLFPGSE